MNDRAKSEGHPTGNSTKNAYESEIAIKIENTVQGILQLIVDFIRISFLSIFSPKKAVKLMDEEHSIGGYSFLILSSLLAALYTQAFGASIRKNSTTYDSVSSALFDKIMSQSFGIEGLISTSIPIVVSVMLWSWIQIYNPKSDGKSNYSESLRRSCFSFGILMNLFGFGVTLALVLRAIIPKTTTYHLILLVPNPMPAWAKYSPIPVFILGLVVCTNILFLHGTYREVIRIRFIRWAVLFIYSLIGFGLISLASQTYDIAVFRKAIGADLARKGSDHTNKFCEGSSARIDSTGSIRLECVLKNESDDTIYISRRNPKLFLRSAYAFKPDSIIISDWGAGNASVLSLNPSAQNWIRITARISSASADSVRRNNNLATGERRKPKIIALWLESIGRGTHSFRTENYVDKDSSISFLYSSERL